MTMMTMPRMAESSSSSSRRRPWKQRLCRAAAAAAATVAAATTTATIALLASSSCCAHAAAATASMSGNNNSKRKDVLRQHHIRPAQRQVPYATASAALPMKDRRTLVESSSTSSTSQQEQQQQHYAATASEEGLLMARMERVMEPFHSLQSSLDSSSTTSKTHHHHHHHAVYWHLLVDASLQNADDVFRELQKTGQVNAAASSSTSDSDSSGSSSSSRMFSSSSSSSLSSSSSSSNVRRNHNDMRRQRTAATQQQTQQKWRMSSSSVKYLPRFLQSLLFANNEAVENNNESDNVFFVNSVEPAADLPQIGISSLSTTPGFITTNTTTELDNNNNAPPPQQTVTTNSSMVVDFNVSTQTEYNVTNVVANVPPNNNSSIDDDEMMNSSSSSGHDGHGGHGGNSSSNNKNDTSTVVYTKSEAQTTTVSSSSSGSDHYDGQSSLSLDGQKKNNDTTDTSSRLGFRPIRIRAILSDLDGGGGYLDTNTKTTNTNGDEMSQQELLLQQIIGPALLSWSAALRVNPVAGNLTVDAHQLMDGISCGPGVHSGLPSAPVPVSHLTTGVADTDLLLYIHLGFVMNETIQQQDNNSTNNNNNSTFTDTNNNTNTTEQSMSTAFNRNNDNNNDNNKAQQQLRTSTTNDSAATAAGNNSTTDDDISESRANNSNNNRGSNASSSWFTPSNNSGYNNNNDNTGNNRNGENDNNNNNNTSSSSWLSPPPPLSPKHICAGDYLAASSVCSTDQLDRPTAAILHICIGPDFFEPQNLHVNIMTIMHELGHALGFNAISMAYFRRPDGSPITPRNATGAIPETLVECTGPTFAHQQKQQQQDVLATQAPSTNVSSGNVSIAGSTGDAQLPRQRGGQQEQPPPPVPTGLTGMLPLPSSEILQFRTVRGGVRVAEVVTPSVQQVVRNHFDCQELPGAELESGEFLPLSTSPGEVTCLGDHWERRLFKSDLMNPVVDALEFNPRFSTITLAYFADSGWYQVDLSRASLAPSWGRGSGCAFVEETCIGQDGQVPQNYDSLFCNNAPRGVSQPGFATDIDGCTPDLLRKAACSMGQYDGELPAQYQYFNGTYGSNIGGSDPFMDYCPVYMGFSNGLCSDSQNEALIKVTSVERLGSRNSRCLAGRVTKTTSWTNPVITKTALCLRIACVVEDRSLRVQVDGSWHTCTREGQEIKSWETGDIAVCPDPIRVCPTFYCPRDCLGTNHVCDYKLGSCVCSGSDCEEEDEEDGDGPSNSPPPAQVAFYSPPESDSQSSQPEKDSPLGDIYFPTERSLREVVDEDEHKVQWEVPIGFSILVALVALITIHHRRRKRRLPLTLAQMDNDDDDLDRNVATTSPATGTSATATTANKHKMIATVVVDLRMNDPRLPHYRDVLIQRGSETDASMTETEGGSSVTTSNGGSAAAATSTPSPPPPTTEVNLTSTIMFDDPATRMPRFVQPNIRRRRFFSNRRHRPGT